jgi:hypothetical protein
MTINVKKPKGNVFFILGVFRGLQRELKKAGCDTADYDKILNGYSEMTYDEILDGIQTVSNGTISFVGRDRK